MSWLWLLFLDVEVLSPLSNSFYLYVLQPECDNAVQCEDQKSEAVSSNIDNNINDKKTDRTANEYNPQSAHMAGLSLKYSFYALHRISNFLLLHSI